MLKSFKAFDLKNKRVLIRVDYNVPIENDHVTDDFRIRASLPTIKHCLNEGASVVLMSHLGRPKGKVVPEMSLIPVGETLADHLEMPIKFSDNCISEDAHDVSLGLKPGEIHLLENLRFHKEETENESRFSADLAKHGQVYINDAFGTAHRAHASNVGVSVHYLQKGIGHLIEKELAYLSEAMKHPKRPLVIIMGGAKIDSKLDLIYRFIELADTILIGGGMVFTFLKAMGKNIGNSLVDPAMVKTAHTIIQKARGKVKLKFPTDVVCASSLDSSGKASLHPSGEIPSDLMGLDIGPKTIEDYGQVIRGAGTVLWNGPMGVFEIEGFEAGTRSVGEALAEATLAGTTTIIGGGDSAAAMKKYGLMDKASHISTGGGASLELLSGNQLPAILALEK